MRTPMSNKDNYSTSHPGYKENEPTRQMNYGTENKANQVLSNNMSNGYQNQNRYQEPRDNVQFGGSVDDEPFVIAGKFKGKESLVSIAVMSLLCGIISFTAIFVSDQVVAMLSEYAIAGPVSNSVVLAVIVAVAALFAGIIDMFVKDTGNETLYKLAIVAVAVIILVLSTTVSSLVEDPWQIAVPVVTAVCYVISCIASTTRPKETEEYTKLKAKKVAQW